jgi:3-oxoacyl-[acyl-carrier protein] reductase
VKQASARPVYLVTGASGAIGSAIAGSAAAEGVVVAVHGSSDESVAAGMERIRQHIPDAELVPAPADFQQEGAIAALVSGIIASQSRLDALVHCAITGGPGVAGPFATTEPANYGVHAALVIGIFQQLCFHALPHLSKRGGAIVALASDAGRFASPRQSIIGSANGGLMSFVRNLALEIAREGVRANCISSSFVADTPSFEKYGAGGRGDNARDRAGLGLPKASDVASLALFLCGSGSAKITGQVISINGGLNA